MADSTVYDELVETIGDEATAALIGKFGGCSIELPNVGRWCPVVDQIKAAVGDEAAKKLLFRFAATNLYVPLVASRNPRAAAVIARFDELSKTERTARAVVRQIAGEQRMSERNVWRILKKSL